MMPTPPAVAARALAHIDVCFDTNIVLEISTLVDLDRAAASGRLAIEPVFARRRERARNSLAAAWLCQQRGLTTFLAAIRS